MNSHRCNGKSTNRRARFSTGNGLFTVHCNSKRPCNTPANRPGNSRVNSQEHATGLSLMKKNIYIFHGLI